MIDAYIHELGDALHGPRTARSEMLAEARDSLVDAAEQYEHEGLDRTAAERRAVHEFGSVREIAPEYQTELGLSQARRTALLVFVVIATQTAVSELLWRSAAPGWSWRPSQSYMALATAVDYGSYAVLGGSLLTALACGIGVRFVRPGRRFVRATGIGAITAWAFFTVGGALLTAFSPMSLTMPTQPVEIATGAMAVALPILMALSARRCIAAA